MFEPKLPASIDDIHLDELDSAAVCLDDRSDRAVWFVLEFRRIQAPLKGRTDCSLEVFRERSSPEGWQHQIALGASNYDFSELRNPCGGRGDDASLIPLKAPEATVAAQANVWLNRYANPYPLGRIDAEKVCPKFVVTNAHATKTSHRRFDR